MPWYANALDWLAVGNQPPLSFRGSTYGPEPMGTMTVPADAPVLTHVTTKAAVALRKDTVTAGCVPGIVNA